MSTTISTGRWTIYSNMDVVMDLECTMTNSLSNISEAVSI